MDFNSILVSFGIEYEGWYFGIGQSQHEKLKFRLCASSWRDELTLATGGDLMKMEGYLHLFIQDGPRDGISRPDKDDDTEKSIEVLGVLWHLAAYDGSSDGVVKPTEESYSVELGITKSAFENLKDAIRAKEAPQLVHLSIPKGLGLEYGHAPDGSVKNWDNSERRFLSVSGLSFAFARQRTDPVDVDEVSNEKLEMGGQLERMAALERHLAPVIQQLANIRLLLLIGVMAVIFTQFV